MFDTLTARLSTALEADARRYPGDSHNRQPVHTVYGGAQLEVTGGCEQVPVGKGVGQHP